MVRPPTVPQEPARSMAVVAIAPELQPSPANGPLGRFGIGNGGRLPGWGSPFGSRLVSGAGSWPDRWPTPPRPPASAFCWMLVAASVPFACGVPTATVNLPFCSCATVAFACSITVVADAVVTRTRCPPGSMTVKPAEPASVTVRPGGITALREQLAEVCGAYQSWWSAGGSQPALHGAKWDLQHLRGLRERQAGAEHEAQYLAVRQAEVAGRVRDLGRRRPLECHVFRAGIRSRPISKQPVVDDQQPAAAQSIPCLPASDGDDPRADAGLAPERPGAPPHREHGVLQDLLAHPAIAHNQIDLGKHDTGMPVVERHEGSAVPAAHPAQQVGVVHLG